ncbi:MAG: hypothetical protein ABI672_17665 [Vicinamibacteria bacterium]
MILTSLLLIAMQAVPASSPAPSPTAVVERPDPMLLGPQVGQALPSFEAPDQNGKAQTFASLKGPNGLVLVFFRSADW